MLRKPKAEKQREYTEQIALELYQNRLLRGKPGDEHSDWAKAEKIVHDPIRTALFASQRPFIGARKPIRQAFKVITWDTPKWFLFSLPQLEWMKLLAVPLVVAAAGSIITGQIQREANQNASLKAYFDKLEELTFEQNLLGEKPNEGAIVLARGRTVAALHELDLLRRTQLIAFLQASDLLEIKEDLAAPVISLKEQNLSGLDLRDVNLVGLNFQQANLEGANLKRAFLWEANLQEADLADTNLEGANLVSANLEGAVLSRANLQGARLEESNLEWAGLAEANLEGANLVSANLEGAVLSRANLQGARLEESNLEWAQDLTSEQLSQALLCRTTLPDDITLDPNRDCEELGIDPETGERIEP